MESQNIGLDLPVKDDAELALQELVTASNSMTEVLNDEEALKINNKTAALIDSSVIKSLIAKAAKQRQKGVINLGKRHDGIASLNKKVSLNERVTGSFFERFFAPIENGVYVIMKRGNLFFSQKDLNVVIDGLEKKIKEFDAEVTAELEALRIRVDAAKRSGFEVPIYVKPAASHEVQIRHHFSNKILMVIEKQDRVLTHMQTLLWNGEIDHSQIGLQEAKIKKQIKSIFNFINSTLRAMHRKAEPKNSSKPSNESVATNVA